MTTTQLKELELFARINANNPALKTWLDAELESTVAILKSNRNPVTIHQAQGAAQLIDKINNLLVSAHKHLHP